MTKSEIRKLFLEKRKSLTEAEHARLSFQISQLFFSSVDLSFLKVVHAFLPIAAKREPDTWLILDRILREFSHIRLAIPKVNVVKNQLENFYFEGLHQLEEDAWGIKQPRQGVLVESEKIDLVIVPLLAFDHAGHRVGYGKGYYDRFLADCNPECIKIGLSLFAPVDNIKAEPQDIAINGCVTPQRFYDFS